MTRKKAFELAMQACKETWNEKTCAEIIKALEQEPTDDATLKDIFCMGCEYKEQELITEKVVKMRDATPEERESVDAYIKSISKPTGVNLGALEQEPKWIPCEERLPKYDVDVLVTDKEVSSTYVGQYCGNGFWWTDTGCEKGRIVAWMPLPKPYEPQKGADR